MPDDLRPQIPVIRRVFEGFSVPVLMHEGVEADDVIATLARRGAERGLDVDDLHRRQGRPAAPRPTTSASSTSASRKVLDVDGAEGRLGGRPRAGRRLAGPDRRHVGQHPGRPRHRPQDGRQAARGVRRPREPARQHRQGLRGQAQGEPPRPRRDGPAGPPARGPPRRPPARTRLGRAPDRPATTPRP